MALGKIYLREILGYRNMRNKIETSLDKNEKFETFDGQRSLVPIAIDYMVEQRPSRYGGQVKNILRLLEDSAVYCKKLRTDDPPSNRKFFKELVSLVGELKVFFTIPKQQQISDTCDLNYEVIVVFIKFLLKILEEIMRVEPDFIVPVKDSIQNLQTELGFLSTFLGDDAPMRLLYDVEVVVNEVGSLVYTLFSTRDDEALETGTLNLALSHFFPKFELLKTKMNCITDSKLPGTPSSVSSETTSVDPEEEPCELLPVPPQPQAKGPNSNLFSIIIF